MNDPKDLKQLEKAKVKALSTEQWATIGESALGFLLGRRSTRVVSSALRKRRQVEMAKEAVEESQAELADLEEDLRQLKEELEEKAQEIQERWDTVAEKIDTVAIHPRRRDVVVQEVAIAWMPFWSFTVEKAGGKRKVHVPAFHIPAKEEN